MDLKQLKLRTTLKVECISSLELRPAAANEVVGHIVHKVEAQLAGEGDLVWAPEHGSLERLGGP